MALHKKLNRLCVFQLWDHYFGEATDFLHSDLKSEKVLNVMNDLGTLIESHMQGQPEYLMGMLFFELCRMAEPRLTQVSGYPCSQKSSDLRRDNDATEGLRDS